VKICAGLTRRRGLGSLPRAWRGRRHGAGRNRLRWRGAVARMGVAVR